TPQARRRRTGRLDAGASVHVSWPAWNRVLRHGTHRQRMLVVTATVVAPDVRHGALKVSHSGRLSHPKMRHRKRAISWRSRKRALEFGRAWGQVRYNLAAAPRTTHVGGDGSVDAPDLFGSGSRRYPHERRPQVFGSWPDFEFSPLSTGPTTI